MGFITLYYWYPGPFFISFGALQLNFSKLCQLGETTLTLASDILKWGLPWWRRGSGVCSAGDAGSIPGSGRSPGEGNGSHSSILGWRIPWTEEPSGLQSMGSQRVGHNGINLACVHTHTHMPTHAHTHMRIQTRARTHTHMRTDTRAHVCAHMHAHAHTHTDMEGPAGQSLWRWAEVSWSCAGCQRGHHPCAPERPAVGLG